MSLGKRCYHTSSSCDCMDHYHIPPHQHHVLLISIISDRMVASNDIISTSYIFHVSWKWWQRLCPCPHGLGLLPCDYVMGCDMDVMLYHVDVMWLWCGCRCEIDGIWLWCNVGFDVDGMWWWRGVRSTYFEHVLSTLLDGQCIDLDDVNRNGYNIDVAVAVDINVDVVLFFFFS